MSAKRGQLHGSALCIRSGHSNGYRQEFGNVVNETFQFYSNFLKRSIWVDVRGHIKAGRLRVLYGVYTSPVPLDFHEDGFSQDRVDVKGHGSVVRFMFCFDPAQGLYGIKRRFCVDAPVVWVAQEQ